MGLYGNTFLNESSNKSNNISPKLFQLVFDEIEPTLPKNWKSVSFFIGYTEGSYSIKYYVTDNSNTTIDCFNLNTLKNRADLMKIFIRLSNKISSIRNNMKDKWSIMTLSIKNDGSISSNFEYDNAETEGLISYERKWKNSLGFSKLDNNILTVANNPKEIK